MVTSYHLNQSVDFIRRAGAKRALRLLRDHRVYNIALGESTISALVMDPSHPMPFWAELRFDLQEFSWTCECGANKPCVHTGALLLHGFQEKKPAWEWQNCHLEQVYQVQHDTGLVLDPEVSSPQEQVGGPVTPVAGQFDLFSQASARQGTDESGENRGAHDPGRKTAWDQDTTEKNILRKPRLPQRTAYSPARVKQLVFRILKRPDGRHWVEPAYLIQDPEQTLFEPYRAGEILETLPEPLEEMLFFLTRGGRSCEPLEEVLESLYEIVNLPPYRLPMYFEAEEHPLRIVQALKLQVRFVREDNSPHLQAPYRPVYTWYFDEGARSLSFTRNLDFAVCKGLLYWYQQDRNWLCFADGWYREVRVLREIGFSSEGWFSAQEIESIRDRCLEERLTDRIDVQFSIEERDVICPRPRLILLVQGDGEGSELFIRFSYPNWDVGYQDRELEKESLDSQGIECLLRRNIEAESEMVHQLVSWVNADLVYERGYYSVIVKEGTDPDLRIQTPINEFLLGYARDLISRGVEVRIENRRIRIAKDLRFSIRRDMDWFGIQAQAGLDESDTAGEIWAASRGMVSHESADSEEQAIQLDEGFSSHGLARRGAEFIILKERDVRQLEYLRRQGMTDQGALKTSAANLVLIDAIYDRITTADRSLEGLNLEDRQEVLDKLQNPPTIPQVEHPKRVKAQLRAYQRTGLSWLVYLHRSNLNGCLADDMGLGKTLQTLSLLQYLREAGELGRVLLISPVVTLANWEQEAERFTPELSLYRHAGTDRADSSLGLLGSDIVLVSYNTLRIDIELFLDTEFDYIILDEAHYIKNHYSQVFKAVRSLKSRRRLSLTGTPIENTLMELWSQMNFLNPGLLGTAKHFYERYFLPIEKQGNAEVLEELKELVQPFILRRTKTQVLDDLPAKEVIVQYCEMDERQANVYREYRNEFRNRILGLFDESSQTAQIIQAEEEGLEPGTLPPVVKSPRKKKSKRSGQASIEIFQFLLKLRQLAIHPPMAGPELAGMSSAKLESLLMLLEEILTENHKVLIFSQFIGSLEAIAAHCRDRDWNYSLLTGSTVDRDGEIKRFQQQPDVRVFLLSLKAGGVGINLTAADYVILFDPWWNPAAENQAIDRAHRMGQQRKVIAFKMIVRGTIEEKILQLQERKSALADEIISEGGGFLGHLDRDEVVNLFSD